MKPFNRIKLSLNKESTLRLVDQIYFFDPYQSIVTPALH
jgi:hypothetical protein